MLLRCESEKMRKQVFAVQLLQCYPRMYGVDV